MNSMKDGIAISESKSGGENNNLLRDTIDMLVNRYVHIWWELCRKTPIHTGKVSDFWTRQRRAKYTDVFIDQLIEKIEAFPKGEDGGDEWKRQVKSLLEDFILKVEFVDIKEIKFLLGSGILDSTEEFVNEARTFDPKIRLEDIGQAMRNVWIMNIIQMLLKKPVKCTHSVFAYSMLYPYTDNYIDNEELDVEKKKAYSTRFEKRLRGQDVEKQNDYEEKIFTLVEFIEKEYKRAAYPNVFESLMGIHKGQDKSILQQQREVTPYDLDVLEISFEKGGTSVLADAFLVQGNLSAEEIEFFFAYGIMLQLCDDLQDVGEDINNKHSTIFSLTAKAWPIDNITNALFQLVNYVVKLIDNLNIENGEVYKNIIRNNCYLLIYFAIGKNGRYYSKAYFSEMKDYIPYNISYMKKLYKKLSKKYRRLKPAYNGTSTEKILLTALKSF